MDTSRQDANREYLELFNTYAGNLVREGKIENQILLNKIDLKEEQRISKAEIENLLKEITLWDNLKDYQKNIKEISSKYAMKYYNYKQTLNPKEDIKELKVYVKNVLIGLDSISKMVKKENSFLFSSNNYIIEVVDGITE